MSYSWTVQYPPPQEPDWKAVYDMGPVLHARWTTVLESRPEENKEWDGWVGVSLATLSDFRNGIVHGRKVEADSFCTPGCPGCNPE